MAEPHGGGGTGLLAFIAVLLAGFLFAGAAFALFLSTPQATATPPLGANASPTSTLDIFVQPTATPSPPATPSPLPSFFLTPTPGLTLPIDTALITPIPTVTVPPITPVPTPTIPSTPRPTRTPAPTATPPNCAASDGSNMKPSIFLGTGNPSSEGPTNKAWCIHQVIIRPFGPDGGPGPEPGRTLLLLNGRRIAANTCAFDGCNDTTKNFAPPRFAPAGSTLTWEFNCEDNPNTIEDECTDPFPGGSTIEIRYEVLPGT